MLTAADERKFPVLEASFELEFISSREGLSRAHFSRSETGSNQVNGYFSRILPRSARGPISKSARNSRQTSGLARRNFGSDKQSFDCLVG